MIDPDLSRIMHSYMDLEDSEKPGYIPIRTTHLKALLQWLEVEDDARAHLDKISAICEASTFKANLLTIKFIGTWIASANDIYEIDPRSEDVKLYTAENARPSDSNYIVSTKDRIKNLATDLKNIKGELDAIYTIAEPKDDLD